ncbi:MAG: cupin domain-containing protein [Myxococcota bacterium]
MAEDWKVFRLEELLARKREMRFPYLEFLRVPSLSCGIYSLAAGSKDLQGPHDEDEVYLVLSGRAVLRMNGEERSVEPGSVLYVPASSEHHFVEIEEDVTLLVFFASGGDAST